MYRYVCTCSQKCVCVCVPHKGTGRTVVELVECTYSTLETLLLCYRHALMVVVMDLGLVRERVLPTLIIIIIIIILCASARSLVSRSLSLEYKRLLPIHETCSIRTMTIMRMIQETDTSVCKMREEDLSSFGIM